MIQTKYDKPTSIWMTITPEIAKYFLSLSLGNRKESQTTVKAYGRDMKTGRWRKNGEPMAFDSNGAFRNGHHRCWSCIQADAPFETLVNFGLPPEECDEFDRGRPRSFFDRMILSDGEKWTQNKAIISVIKSHFRYLGVDKPTDSEMEDFMDRNSEELEWCYKTFLYKARKNSKKAGVALAIFYAAKMGVNKDELQDFANSVETGLYDISKGTAIYKLLKDLDSFRGAGRLSQKTIMLATENAIKDYLNRKDRHKTYLLHANSVWSDLEAIKQI